MKATQLRLNDEMAEYIEKESSEVGMSQNSFTLMLISLGKKIWDSPVNVEIKGD